MVLFAYESFQIRGIYTRS